MNAASESSGRHAKVAPLTVVHVPHSSSELPRDVVGSLSLSASELRAELLRMTDWYTDELFGVSPDRAAQVRFPVSRLIVDPERFEDDREEPMAAKGMGVIYTCTSDGQRLRPAPTAREREALLSRFYRPHHDALGRRVAEAIHRHDRCLIIDGHSFPTFPLPYEDDQGADRPEICLGTDAFHTPDGLRESALRAVRAEGLTVDLDRPFSGSLVPADRYRRDPNVWSLMIEVRRGLYMDEATGERLPGFSEIRAALCRIMDAVVRAAA